MSNVQKCDRCKIRQHSKCEVPVEWCECVCGLVPLTYNANVTEMTAPRRGRPAGIPAQQTINAQRREAAWHNLARLTGGTLDVGLVREVHRRHGVMMARAHTSARCSGNLTDAIESVLADVKAGRL